MVTIRCGGIVLGIGFLALGAFAVTNATVYGWRGHRLGAEVTTENVVIHHYFTNCVIPISRVRSAYRTAEAIRIQTLEDSIVIDDCHFPDLETRDAFFEALSRRLGTTICPTEAFGKDTAKSRSLRILAKYSGGALWLIAGCAFLAFGLFRFIQGDWFSAVVFSGMGIAFCFSWRIK
jgi:hypothetical protein